MPQLERQGCAARLFPWERLCSRGVLIPLLLGLFFYQEGVMDGVSLFRLLISR